MKKQPLFTIFFAVLAFQLTAQIYVPVVLIVSDFITNKNINGAQVSIRQAGWATKSTGTDGKVNFDNVPVGAINFIITKDGYQLYEGEENVSAEVKSNTFRIPMTIIPTTKDKILVTGEVTDKDGRDIEGAWVEVKAANIIQNGLTDKSGNYSIEISLNTGYTVSNLAIEAKKGDCKLKQNADIPRGNVVSKDIKLDCTVKSDVKKEEEAESKTNPVNPYEDDYFLMQFKECKRQSGTNLQVKLLITAKEDDYTIYIYGPNNSSAPTRIFDNKNNTHLVQSTKIANNIVTGDTNRMRLVKGVPTETTLNFQGVSLESVLVTLLELSFVVEGTSWFKVAKFRNMAIK